MIVLYVVVIGLVITLEPIPLTALILVLAFKGCLSGHWPGGSREVPMTTQVARQAGGPHQKGGGFRRRSDPGR